MGVRGLAPGEDYGGGGRAGLLVDQMTKMAAPLSSCAQGAARRLATRAVSRGRLSAGGGVRRGALGKSPKRAVFEVGDSWQSVDVKSAKKKAQPKKAASKKKTPKRTVAKKKAPSTKPAPRADLGLPIDGFFAKQPAHLRPIVDELRKLVESAAPDADSSLKWGMPFYTIDGTTMCAIAGHKSHVNLILSGPPGTYDDPEGLLTGEGKTGRHLKLKTLDDLPRDAVRGWLRTASKLARPRR